MGDGSTNEPGVEESKDEADPPGPSLEPYIGKLERFELFSTNQCYYLVGGNKSSTVFRILKMDRTLIERPTADASAAPTSASAVRQTPTTDGSADDAQALADNTHAAKPSLRPLSDFLTEDPNVYSQEEIRDMLDMIHDGNRMRRPDSDRHQQAAPGTRGGGLNPIVKAYGIVGFVRFLDCYYLTLVTRRSKVGSIGGNGIYTIKNTETIPLKPAEQRMPNNADDIDPSAVLLSMWNRGKRSVGLGLTNREIAELRYQGLYQVMDLSKGFYLSYTYDMTRTLQENFLLTATKPYPPPPFKEMYAWNYFLTREFESCLSTMTSFYWLNPIIHGSFVQRRVNDYGRILDIVLLARRSRHFAGTRYLKRGVSEQGKVANDVEHEQILHDDSKAPPGTFCSFLQVRGSIPTFWTQESSVTMPKPPIELNRVDPTYTATRSHFEDLIKRYSTPILVLDLVKQSEKREREVRVGNEFRHAIDYINTTIDDTHKIRYCALDYSHISKHRYLDVSASLNEVSTWAVNQTGFFCSAPKWKVIEGGIISPFSEADSHGSRRLAEKLGIQVFPMEQSGVLRTNCIDCLDRTNVAQFSAGVEAISQQLVVMGIRSRAHLSPSSNIVRVLIDMYVEIGDNIALQYGGSEAHKKVSAQKSDNISGPIGKHKELLTSIRRYYSNAFTDRLKQDAINLFLGYYLPYRHTVPLWEMESDYYLHNFHVKSGISCSMREYRRAFGIVWNEDHDVESPPAASNSVLARNSFARRSHSMESLSKFAQESKSVQRVRTRCELQNQALSTWWKQALQAHLQQRMWMQLGRSQVEIALPPRFERVYQPENLGQFDRYFSRAWSTPVRRSHAAQHSDGIEDGEAGNLSRVITSGGTPLTEQHALHEPRELGSKPGTVTLGHFVDKHGFDQWSENSLRRFSEYHSSKTHVFPDVAHPGNLEKISSTPREEYVHYLSPSEDAFGPPQTYRAETVQEFKECLSDYTLESNDVLGIQELAEKSHLYETIRYGPYEGLSKHDSAIEVATTIQEQFNALDSISMGAGGQRLVERELRRRGMFKAGVKEAVAEGTRHFATAEKQYSEIIGENRSSCRRSDLTTRDSLRLYASEFSGNEELSIADQIFLLARKPDGLPSHGSDKRAPLPLDQPPSSFVKKAARLGISIVPHEEIKKAAVSPLYLPERRHIAPEGFEQINDDLFSRKDNKFMVFNGAGVGSWKGAQPITKLSHTENIVLNTFT